MGPVTKSVVLSQSIQPPPEILVTARKTEQWERRKVRTGHGDVRKERHRETARRTFCWHYSEQAVPWSQLIIAQVSKQLTENGWLHWVLKTCEDDNNHQQIIAGKQGMSTLSPPTGYTVVQSLMKHGKCWIILDQRSYQHISLCTLFFQWALLLYIYPSNNVSLLHVVNTHTHKIPAHPLLYYRAVPGRTNHTPAPSTHMTPCLWASIYF